MKKKPKLRLVKSPPVLEVELDDITPEGVRAAFIVRFGPECAAWLVNRFRATIRRYGCFPMHIKASEDEPAWFQIAIGYLKQQTRKWSVVVQTQRGEKKYRVMWLGGSRAPKDIPDVIRPV